MTLKIIILGFLKRYGSQHGYELKEKIASEVSDFVNVKLSNVYYHLEKMNTQGYLIATRVEGIKTPDKINYSISKTGVMHYQSLLKKLLTISDEKFYNDDVILFFSNEYSKKDLYDYFKEKYLFEKDKFSKIKKHKNEVLKWIPKEYKDFAEMIFEHTIYHTKAEALWTEKVIKIFEGNKHE